MTLSMTGFARLEQPVPGGTLSVELKSVNHRYLELNFRMPDTLKASETAIRDLLKKRLSRGKVDVSVRLTTDDSADAQLHVDTALLSQVQHALKQVADAVPNAQPVNALELLKWPGVMAVAALDIEQIAGTLLTLTDQATQQLIAHRQREGEELAHTIETRLVAMAEIVAEVQKDLPDILVAQRNLLNDKIAALDVELDPQRLAQEVALLAQKADVAEELDRLNLHIEEVRHILKSKGAVGRKLDFLMQEFNREANTLSSKAIVIQTTRSAVDLKVLIEQMREQIQNIE
jgi:uncharacterized protein (TIGR00255 family)